MSSASPSEFRQALQINVDKLAGEASQRNHVARALALVGHRAAPKVVAGRMHGSSIRLYLWEGTPAGDIILATGPSFLPKVLAPSDIQQEQPGIYILASPDTTKAAASVAKVGAGYKAKVKPEVQRAVRAAPPKTRERAAKAVARVEETVREVERPSAASVAEAEKAELMAGLKALLG